MRAVVQRVTGAEVRVEGAVTGRIGDGLLVLLGVAPDDGEADVRVLVGKLLGLRIFADEQGRMNRSVTDTGGGVLVVSQFTLLADVRKGRRPSFTGTAAPEAAQPLVDRVVDGLREGGVEVATGRFGALMDVDLVNHGPVTLVIDVVGGSVR